MQSDTASQPGAGAAERPRPLQQLRRKEPFRRPLEKPGLELSTTAARRRGRDKSPLALVSSPGGGHWENPSSVTRLSKHTGALVCSWVPRTGQPWSSHRGCTHWRAPASRGRARLPGSPAWEASPRGSRYAGTLVFPATVSCLRFGEIPSKLEDTELGEGSRDPRLFKVGIFFFL